jgi:hypothetical protein
VSNGLLLRSDIHRLFDKGYVTVTPDHHFEVSRRLKDDFETGARITPCTDGKSAFRRTPRNDRIPSC